MNAEEPKPPEGQKGATCPKRLWVMLTLSDDEALDEAGTLPQGLRFHLSRCPSCRALADRLQTVTDAVRALSDSHPSTELLARADAQAKQALADGVRFTGRVTIPEEPERVGPAVGGHHRSVWLRYSSYAAAAAILLGFGLYWISMFVGQPSRRLAENAGSPTHQRRVVGPAWPGADTGLASSKESQSADDGASAAGEQVPGAIGRQLADAGGDEGAESKAATPSQPGRDPRGRVCRHSSYVEAAECDDMGCIYRATVLPDTGQRDLGWGRALFDTRRHTMSTSQHDQGE